MKISIVGLGHVGTALAYTLVLKGLGEELVLVSRNRDKAQGEALDLTHCQSFTSHRSRIIPGGPEDSAGSDIIILTASVPLSGGPGNRLVLGPGNRRMIQEMLPDLARRSPQAVILVVTNPVDIMSYYAWKDSGFPSERVMGIGTLIDSARFRSELSRHHGIHPDDTRAYVLGEHGDSQLALLSSASAGGQLLGDPGTNREIFQRTARVGYDIMVKKGYSNFAISLATSLVVESILANSLRTIPVSCLAPEYWNLGEVFLSLPAVIGRGGIQRILKPAMDTDEQKAFVHSAQTLLSARKLIEENLH